MKTKPEPISHFFGVNKAVSRYEAAQSLKSLRSINLQIRRTNTGWRLINRENNIITTRP